MVKSSPESVRPAPDSPSADEALRRSEERYRLMVSSVRDYAIIMLDPAGRVESWNAGAEAIKGYKADEILGHHISFFYTPEDLAADKPKRLLHLAAQDGRVEDEGWRVRKDGTRFWASVIIEPIRDNDDQLIGFVKVVRDLTEKRNAEAERIRLAQAQEAIRLRDEFLSIASHELKTPLSAVQLQLESVLHRAQSLDEKTRKKVERAYRGGVRLSDLIEALLDVSRIAAGKFFLALSKFDLGKAVEEVAERFREQAARDQCELILHLEERVMGEWDRLRVEQVVTNLLSNALKYAAGTSVELGVKGVGENAVLTVSDHGPGIPQSEWDRVFGRFERAASIRHYGGLGLGLYVARQVVEAHGGSISSQAVKPRGARFVVTLPRRAHSSFAGRSAVAGIIR